MQGEAARMNVALQTPPAIRAALTHTPLLHMHLTSDTLPSAVHQYIGDFRFCITQLQLY
jgi:hypothetical protein